MLRRDAIGELEGLLEVVDDYQRAALFQHLLDSFGARQSR